MIGIIFLVQIPAWNVRFTKTTWYMTFCGSLALMAFENRSYKSKQAGMNRTTRSMSVTNDFQSTDEKFNRFRQWYTNP
jgi:hypothetical protein